MYKTITEAIDLVNGLKRESDKVNFENIDVVVCPPFTALSQIQEILTDNGIRLGAQNAYWQQEGAFTGEISCKMLKDAGVSFVIIGHSERRQHFGETNETVNNRLKAVLDSGLTPIICVGERLQEREKNLTFKVLEDHIKNGLKDIPAEDALKCVIAYEPVWAIGTGKTATPEQAQVAHKFIRGLLVKLYSQATAEAIRIQYGGSVKPDNIKDLMQQPDIDGALIGGASLKVESFAAIIMNAQEVKKS